MYNTADNYRNLWFSIVLSNIMTAIRLGAILCEVGLTPVWICRLCFLLVWLNHLTDNDSCEPRWRRPVNISEPAFMKPCRLLAQCLARSGVSCCGCCEVWGVVTLLLCGKCSVAGNIAAWQVITVITCCWASVGFLESLGEKPGCISLYLGQRLGRATTPWWVVVQHIQYTIPGCT